MLTRFAFIPALFAIFCLTALSADTEAAKPQRTAAMDYGPFLSASVLETKKPKVVKGATKKAPPVPIYATKGIAIKLPGKVPATVCFDTDTLRMAAGWTGVFLNFNNTMLSNHKGEDNCTPDGTVIFTNTGLGWATGGDFSDPRPRKLGPLPKDRAHYQGLYVNGDQVILSYTVAGVNILETPAYETVDGVSVFTRTFNLDPFDAPLTVNLGNIASGPGPIGNGVNVVSAVLIGDAMGANFEIVGSENHLTIPAHTARVKLKVAQFTGAKIDDPIVFAALKKLNVAGDLSAFCKGGPAHWKPIETVGKLGTGELPYVVDTLTLPESNPWNAWMRTTGMDFFSDGRAAVCTLNGDVWIVSGIDDKLQKLTWKRFATGLFEPLGLKIVDDQIYVAGRDQITRLHDLNGDGEADFYENFNNDTTAHFLYHAFVMDLDTDSKGNFYYARCGNSVPNDYPDHGCLFKVSKDGQKCELVATGLRVANGLTIGPNDQICMGDNEGQWTPSSKISFVKQGEFLGYTPHHHLASPPKDFAQPMCWIPHSVDTSSGGEAWISSDKWGPLKGHYVHTSFGKSILMLVLNEDVNGIAQGATMPFSLSFATGIMRPRFNPKDGQLYVTGVGGGWQTNGVRDGAVQRVRYTGKPANMPIEFHVKANGISIVFSDPLDKPYAEDAQNFSVEQWNYKWMDKYGSAEFSVTNPEKKEHDSVDVKSVKMMGDRTVFLEISGLKPVMQMQIKYKIKGADGNTISQSIYNTIHVVPAK